MNKPEFFQENTTHKILKNFEIQTDHIITARRKDQVLRNKKEEFVILFFSIPADT